MDLAICSDSCKDCRGEGRPRHIPNHTVEVKGEHCISVERGRKEGRREGEGERRKGGERRRKEGGKEEGGEERGGGRKEKRRKEGRREEEGRRIKAM